MTVPREIPGVIPSDRVVELMSALGVFLSQTQIRELKEEIKHAQMRGHGSGDADGVDFAELSNESRISLIPLSLHSFVAFSPSAALCFILFLCVIASLFLFFQYM